MSEDLPPVEREVRRARASLAIHTRFHADDAAGLTERRRALAEAKLARYIADVVATAPPLSAAQRDRLAALLRPAATSSEVASR